MRVLWQILVLMSLALMAMLSREHAISAEELSLRHGILSLKSELAWQSNRTHDVSVQLKAERVATSQLRSTMHSYLTQLIDH